LSSRNPPWNLPSSETWCYTAHALSACMLPYGCHGHFFTGYMLMFCLRLLGSRAGRPLPFITLLELERSSPPTRSYTPHARRWAYPPFTIPLSTTAKVSSPLLLPRTVSYDATSKPQQSARSYRAMSEQKTGRRRRSSSLLYQEPPETIEHMSDQAALPNLNANWVNAKGQ